MAKHSPRKYLNSFNKKKNKCIKMPNIAAIKNQFIKDKNYLNKRK